jgi:hypothetical protein
MSMSKRPSDHQPRTPSKAAVYVAIVALFAGIIANFWDSPVAAADAVRVTTSFDVKYAAGVLKQVSRVFSGGFGQAELSRVDQDINALKPDEPKVWQFNVEYKGNAEQLEIRALMDDLGMIDLDFAASPDAAPAVRAAVDGYLNGRGG